MTLQPVTQDGKIVDYFDDGYPDAADVSTSAAVVGPEQEELAGEEPTATEPEVLAGQPEPAAPAPPLSARAPITREDPTDFDGCDVKIEIMLHRPDGHPQGRLVSVLVHNFSEAVVARVFRERELTKSERLDNLPHAYYSVAQLFLLQLAGLRQKKLEEEAKRARRPVTAAVGQVVSAVPVTSASTAASPSPQAAAAAASPPVSAPLPAQAPPAATPLTTTGAEASGKKKEGGGKYQSIPLF